MKIAIGADHRGREVEHHLIAWLGQHGHEVVTCGPRDNKACDYPDAAFEVAQQVADKLCDRGILVDGTGIGMCIAANKVHSVRAALVHDEVGADASRRHTDANVLCLPADLLGMRIIDRIVKTWLATEFEGGRHSRRIAKIAAIEDHADPRVVHAAPAVTQATAP